MFDVIVIGGGPAGVTAALRCRELGASVALVERGSLGGTCTNDGCVPTRVLAKAARLLRDTEHFDDYGLVGERPTLDFQHLLSQTQQRVYSLHEKKQLIVHLEESGVRLYVNVGTASFIDSHTLALGGDETTALEGKTFILCVGGHARRLTIPGAEYLLTHSDVWTLKQLPRSAIVIGAAATGCQLASIFATFGTKVTLIDLAPRLLPGEDEVVSRVMEGALRRRGIEIKTGIAGLEQVEKREEGLRVHYRDAEGIQVMEAEIVIIAVGWPGNSDSLKLDEIGVRTERSYVMVDDYLRTSVPHIFAAGDITGRMMLVQSASYDARVAADNAVLGDSHRYQHQIVPHGGFTDPEYASVGLTETQARDHEEIAVAVVSFEEIDRAVIDRRPEGVCKLIVSAASHRLLGAHVVGEQALEVIHLVAAGMMAGMTVEQLAQLEIAYPTYAAIVGLAARRLVHDLGVTEVAPQWRTLGKRVTVEWERREGNS
jgi:pyruvate/2-oxoglutarate dehydrogenase complex dihydrolipoamide dehydrogenase (E3) component